MLPRFYYGEFPSLLDLNSPLGNACLCPLAISLHFIAPSILGSLGYFELIDQGKMLHLCSIDSLFTCLTGRPSLAGRARWFQLFPYIFKHRLQVARANLRYLLDVLLFSKTQWRITAQIVQFLYVSKKKIRYLRRTQK